MTCTRTTLLERMMVEMNMGRLQAQDVLANFIEIMKDTLESGEDIMISGFGKFCVKEKASRKGRNPATDSVMILPKRRVVTFKTAGKLKDQINK